ncbi:LysR family transcriptional regulator [Tsukamurella soli]|uniref:LysR family transcriptional regulator n=1 Tax=Tsukamurella soli TaxID=644556 RepID=UPI0031E55787
MSDPVLDILPLRSVVAVARCGGVHRAAATLHLTQSTVSAHLRRIEKETGAAVVAKAGRGIRFTEHGERLLAAAERILAAHDEAVSTLVAPSRKTLVVATIEHGADHLIPVLSNLLSELPGGYSAQFRLDRSAYVADAIGAGAADVAVFLAPAGHPDAVGTLPLCWYAAKDFVAGAGPLPIIVFDAPCVLRAPATGAAHALPGGATVVAEAANLAGLYAATRSGLGVTLLPEIDAVDGIRPMDGLPAPAPLALAVSFSERVPERVRRAVRRDVAALAEP